LQRQVRIKMIKKFLRAFQGKAKSEDIIKEKVQSEREEMKEGTHESEQVEQDAQEEIRETEDEE
jgi:hypothetical protein